MEIALQMTIVLCAPTRSHLKKLLKFASKLTRNNKNANSVSINVLA